MAQGARDPTARFEQRRRRRAATRSFRFPAGACPARRTRLPSVTAVSVVKHAHLVAVVSRREPSEIARASMPRATRCCLRCANPPTRRRRDAIFPIFRHILAFKPHDNCQYRGCPIRAVPGLARGRSNSGPGVGRSRSDARRQPGGQRIATVGRSREERKKRSSPFLHETVDNIDKCRHAAARINQPTSQSRICDFRAKPPIFAVLCPLATPKYLKQ